MSTKTVTLADLVEDFSLYPRHAVDDSHVAALAEAERAGETLPPPIVEADTLRIVDGFHRTRAHRRVHGDGAKIKVEVRTYASETELINEAIRLNAAHGRKLDNQDRVRSILMLQQRGVDTETIALTLHITEQRVEVLRVRVAIREDDSGHKEPVAVKPVLWSKGSDAPRVITTQQYATQRSSNGWRPQQVVTQLIREIRDRVADLDDPSLRARLWELHDEIERQVPAPERHTA
jgi:hypothetical protein